VLYLLSSNLWKWAITGVIKYDDGKSESIKISRYGGFFKRFNSGRYYIFFDDNSRESWKVIINNFLMEAHK
jgi:hypothetical protein